MRDRFGTVLLGVAVATGAPLAAFAHHSLSAEFDFRKSVQLTGIVTRIEWTNPHALLYLNVHDPATGKTMQWALQLSSPNALAGLGWTRRTLSAGETITASGVLSRQAWRSVSVREIRLPDGRKIFGRPAAVDDAR